MRNFLWPRIWAANGGLQTTNATQSPLFPLVADWSRLRTRGD